MKNKILLNKVALLLTAFLVSVSAFAQTNKVSGTVVDESGSPVPGVFVSADGTNSATSTDAQGRFELNVPASAKTLSFDMLGFGKEVVEIGSKNIFSVILTEDTTMLNETVVVGYGTMIRKELTSSVASVSSENLGERASAMNIVQGMQGKLAGVNIRSTSGRPGGELNVRVRGKGSVNASSDPLYVVDGVVDVDPSIINTADIDKIDVLKDAAATAMYGAKGANGVVMITTKTGKKGGSSVTFSTQTGVSMLTRKMDLLNSAEYMQALEQAYAFSGSSAPEYLLTPNDRLFTYKMNGGSYARDERGYLIPTPKYDTDWQDEAYRKALVTTNNVSFTSNVDNTSVYANIGYQDVQGIMTGTDAKQYSGMVNVQSQFTPWLDAQFSANVSRREEIGAPESGWYNDAIFNTSSMSPLIPVKYPDGIWGSQSDICLGTNIDNPLKIIDMYHSTTNTNQVLLNAGFTFHLAKGLDFNVRGNYNKKQYTNNYFVEYGLKGFTDSENDAKVTNNTYTRWSNEDYLSYDNVFFDGDLKSNFTLGASWYYYNMEGAVAEARGIPEELFQYHNLSTGTNPRPATSSYDHNTMNSYYFRTNQVLLGRYMFGLTLRADGASNFGTNKKYGFFPSASAAWDIAAEPWFASAKNTVNQLKFRVSYGAVGNSSIGSYVTMAQYASGTTYLNGVPSAYVVFGNMANQDLSWETIKQFDAGLDIGLWNDRVNVIADYYIKDSENLLFNMQIPYTTGYKTATMNVGKLRNKGFELTINSHVIDNRNFKWDIDAIWSTNKTIAVDLIDDPFITSSNARAYKGGEFCRWFLLHRVGTWSTDEVDLAAKYGQHPGDPKWEDVDGDYKYTDADRYLAGNILPRGEASLVNTFFIDGFTFSVDLGAMYGMSLNTSGTVYQESNFGLVNGRGALRNAWTPSNQNTMVPALRLPSDDNAGTYYGIGEIDDWWIEPGDFLRVRNISLSYDFKHKLLKSSKAVKGLILGVNVENAYIFTKFSGYDPEVAAWGTYDVGGGDLGCYPKPMTVTGNLKITF